MRLILVVVATALLASSGPSAETDSAVSESATLDLAALLGHQLVGREAARGELQAFLDPRVPPMPIVNSAKEWRRYSERLRRDLLANVTLAGEAARWAKAPLRVEWFETLPGGPGYSIRKLRYEAVPGMWIPALLYLPDKPAGKMPVVLNVNGHEPIGKAVGYKQIRCINQVRRGMLALNVEWLGMGQLRLPNYSHGRMNQLDLCGTSGLAPFYLAMQRGLDVLLDMPQADHKRVAVTGLSGGGWQTIYFCALEPRVTLAVPVAGYSGYRTRNIHWKDLGDSEQAPCDMAVFADYTHLTAMMAPRPTLLIYNSKDNCCFESGYALPPLMDAARPVFRLFNREDALRSHVNDNPGNHNYEVDNRQAFYRMVGDFFYPGDPTFDAKEIPSEPEVKTAEQLAVPVPGTNADFNSLALGLSRGLPAKPAIPAQPAAFQKWQRQQRTLLRGLIHTKDYGLVPSEAGRRQAAGQAISEWRLRIGDCWTLPATEIQPTGPRGVTIVIADGGRRGVTNQIERLLSDGQRVVAIDPFYFGECVPDQYFERWALFVSAVGERPLGIQVAQVTAVARWLAREHPSEPLAVRAIGPRSGLVALAAAALEPQAIARVELKDALRSLKDVLERNLQFSQMPEAFCFGLLKEFDIEQLEALVRPRPILGLD